MARCPFASWRRLPGTEPPITPRTVIFHTCVGNLTGTDSYFRSGRSGGIEAHFGVGGRWGPDLAAGLDGAAWQWRDTSEQADANRTANNFAVSIETADNAPRFAADILPWTGAQVDMLVRLGRWLRETHQIPPRVCRSPVDAGFGWHGMWDNTSFELADGTTPWTPSAGKECPGPARISQLRTVVLPAIFADHHPTTLLEDDVTETQAAQLKRIHDALFLGHALTATPLDNLFGDTHRLHQAFIVPGTTNVDQTVELLFARVRAIAAAVPELLDDELLAAADLGSARDQLLAALAAVDAAVARVEAHVTPPAPEPEPAPEPV